MPEKHILRRFVKPSHRHDRCVAEALSAAQEKCILEGTRLTPTRRRVLELVWNSHEPVKAYDILDKLHDEDRKPAPPTVYRALDFLLDMGLVHRIESLNAYVGCGNPAHSHNSQFLICRGCGTVAELDDPRVTKVVAEQARGLGFRIDRETIEIAGLCADCSRPARKPNEAKLRDRCEPGK